MIARTSEERTNEYPRREQTYGLRGEIMMVRKMAENG